MEAVVFEVVEVVDVAQARSVPWMWVSCDRTAVQLTGARNIILLHSLLQHRQDSAQPPGPGSGGQFTVVGVRYLSCVIVLPRRRSASTDHCTARAAEHSEPVMSSDVR